MEANPTADRPPARLGSGGIVVFGAFFIAIGVLATTTTVIARGDWPGIAGSAAFGAVGLAIVAFGIFLRRRERANALRRAEHPDAPWRWREDWARGEIAAGTVGRTSGGWIFALLWNGITIPIVIYVVPPGRADNGLEWLGVLFLAIGSLVLLSAIHETRRAVRFGRCVFRFEGDHGTLGGTLRGHVHFGSPLQLAGDPELHLVCLQKTPASDDTANEIPLWETAVKLDRAALVAHELRALPVHFHVPADAPPSTDEAGTGRRGVDWKLSVRAACRGPDLNLTFTVPVFPARETPGARAPKPTYAHFAADPLAAQAAAPKTDLRTASAALTQAGLRWIPAEQTSDRHARLEFPAGRLARTARWVTGAAAICVGISVATAVLGAPLVFSVMFAFPALVLAAIAWTFWFDGSSVLLEGDDLVIVRERPLARGEKRVRRADVARCEVRRDLSSGDRIWYSIAVTGRPLGEITAPQSGPETFLVRKLRREIALAERSAPERAAELRRQLAALPAFVLTAGTGIQGTPNAQAIADFLFAQIRPAEVAGADTNPAADAGGAAQSGSRFRTT